MRLLYRLTHIIETTSTVNLSEDSHSLLFEKTLAIIEVDSFLNQFFQIAEFST